MKIFIISLVFACCYVGIAFTDTIPEDFEAHIEETDFKITEDSGYKYGYKTSNNIKIEEESDGQNIVEGSYSYVDPDGRTHTVTYIAGAGIGFQPTGDDIHPEVSAGIELNLKNPPQEEKKLEKDSQ
ncbi:CLUMA_CG012859, isoform A [Clunio marinus]|uniref:CLUMA_CG012859, isoform A n=1 Tax=Clunio marinus TaxID=568069 RepID=A0A1J1IH15_9DIPT|nr:CLUMA_CG012859, isoform A [Clunio marinus]